MVNQSHAQFKMTWQQDVMSAQDNPNLVYVWWLLISVPTGMFEMISYSQTQPGESLIITCRVSGYSLADGYRTGQIRHCERKPVDWIFDHWDENSSRLYQNNPLKNKFSYNRDISDGMVTMKGQICSLRTHSCLLLRASPHSDTNHNTQAQV